MLAIIELYLHHTLSYINIPGAEMALQGTLKGQG